MKWCKRWRNIIKRWDRNEISEKRTLWELIYKDFTEYQMLIDEEKMKEQAIIKSGEEE
jgi:hypothetical protein